MRAPFRAGQFMLLAACALPSCGKTARPSATPESVRLAQASPLVGQPAPDIGGHDIDGNPLRLSDFRGQVVVLHFWGHW